MRDLVIPIYNLSGDMPCLRLAVLFEVKVVESNWALGGKMMRRPTGCPTWLTCVGDRLLCHPDHLALKIIVHLWSWLISCIEPGGLRMWSFTSWPGHAGTDMADEMGSRTKKKNEALTCPLDLLTSHHPWWLGSMPRPWGIEDRWMVSECNSKLVLVIH
jgi:hypothetical protein